MALFLPKGSCGAGAAVGGTALEVRCRRPSRAVVGYSLLQGVAGPPLGAVSGLGSRRQNFTRLTSSGHRTLLRVGGIVEWQLRLRSFISFHFHSPSMSYIRHTARRGERVQKPRTS